MTGNTTQALLSRRGPLRVALTPTYFTFKMKTQNHMHFYFYNTIKAY